jgi:hypothetical protein
MPAHHPLIYNGTAIADKGEALSLTDMWKAANSPVNKEPWNWSRKEGAAFIEAVALTQNLPHSQVMTTKKGKGGATFAHWQIGLAYAKYLSPEFHMWCNTQVRAVMEGKPPAAVPEEIVELLRRTDGIARMLSHKVTGIEKALNDLAIADGLTAGEVCDLAKVAITYPRGISGRVSRRLGAYCRRMNEKPRIQRLGRVRAQLFPAHLVREWLDLEGRSLIKTWINERQSQGRLKLVPRE